MLLKTHLCVFRVTLGGTYLTKACWQDWLWGPAPLAVHFRGSCRRGDTDHMTSDRWTEAASRGKLKLSHWHFAADSQGAGERMPANASRMCHWSGRGGIRSIYVENLFSTQTHAFAIVVLSIWSEEQNRLGDISARHRTSTLLLKQNREQIYSVYDNYESLWWLVIPFLNWLWCWLNNENKTAPSHCGKTKSCFN